MASRTSLRFAKLPVGRKKPQLSTARATCIGHFFIGIEHCDRVATRFEKHGCELLAVLRLAAIRRRLRHYECIALVGTWPIILEQVVSSTERLIRKGAAL